MSFDTRNNSAMMKRAEQLKRWEESETNREPSVPKSEKGRKIKFSSGCVFLAACLAGDKEEVVNLIENGADINTANVDGLTALHQACIDDNLDMVEFLVEHGADINRQDNEGWTPLHATASCGFVSIARYLVEHGADISAVNSDGELAVDLAVDIAHLSPMIEYMQKLVAEHNIDCDKARRAEEEMMLSDAKRWLRSDASEADNPHPKTGATALHVAAAKGYKKVLSLLLAGRANVDKQDNDGWTPLHAAAHWGQKESAEMLVDALADMDVRNYAGQTCIDVAERKMVKFLEDLRANNKRMKRRPSSQISSRISDTIENHIENTPTKFIRVEVKPDTKDPVNEHIEEDGLSNLERITESDETDSELTDSTESSHSTSISEAEGIRSYDKPKLMPEKVNSETAIDEDAPWRRGSAARTRNQPESPPKNQVPEKDVKSTESDVILRRTQSFENDEKFYQKYNELRARIKANSCPILPATQNPNVLGTVNTPIQNYSVQRSASLKDHRYFRKPITSPPASPNTPVATPNSTAPTTPTTPNTTPIRRSFVPPVRDEESETQRKAHAKRVRETRRSTQGVTLDEIKSAEELVKKKNSTMNNNNNTSFKLEDASSGTTFPPNNSTIIPSAPAVIAAANLSSSIAQRRINTTNAMNTSNQQQSSMMRPVSAPVGSMGSTNSIASHDSSDRSRDSNTNNSENTTVLSRRTTNNGEDKENDKENDNRSALATQAVIQRRRKPKRRSTGVVHIDMDDLEPERQDSAGDNEEKESGNERSSRSRLGSTVSVATDTDIGDTKSNSKDKTENGELIDYKALWEAAKLENDKLKQQLKKKDDEIIQARATVERFTNATTKNSLSEIEKRERRAMERKLSEMEEELKQLEVFKTENQRLKEENGALIRVISKLSK